VSPAPGGTLGPKTPHPKQYAEGDQIVMPNGSVLTVTGHNADGIKVKDQNGVEKGISGNYIKKGSYHGQPTMASPAGAPLSTGSSVTLTPSNKKFSDVLEAHDTINDATASHADKLAALNHLKDKNFIPSAEYASETAKVFNDYKAALGVGAPALPSSGAGASAGSGGLKPSNKTFASAAEAKAVLNDNTAHPADKIAAVNHLHATGEMTDKMHAAHIAVQNKLYNESLSAPPKWGKDGDGLPTTTSPDGTVSGNYKKFSSTNYSAAVIGPNGVETKKFNNATEAKAWVEGKVHGGKPATPAAPATPNVQAGHVPKTFTSVTSADKALKDPNTSALDKIDALNHLKNKDMIDTVEYAQELVKIHTQLGITNPAVIKAKNDLETHMQAKIKALASGDNGAWIEASNKYNAAATELKNATSNLPYEHGGGTNVLGTPHTSSPTASATPVHQPHPADYSQGDVVTLAPYGSKGEKSVVIAKKNADGSYLAHDADGNTMYISPGTLGKGKYYANGTAQPDMGALKTPKPVVSATPATTSAHTPKVQHGQVISAGKGAPPPVLGEYPKPFNGKHGDSLTKKDAETQQLADNLAPDYTKMTGGETTAIRQYTGNDYYKSMNNHLRFGDPTTPDNIDRIAKVTSGLKKYKTTEPMTVFRGLDAADINESFHKGELVPGSVLRDRGIMSTSIARDTAFSMPGQLIIRVPKGARGAYVEKISKYPHEKEFIMPPNRHMRIVKTYKVNGKYVIEAEIMMPGDVMPNGEIVPND